MRTRWGFFPGRRPECPRQKLLGGWGSTGHPLTAYGWNRRAFQSLWFSTKFGFCQTLKMTMVPKKIPQRQALKFPKITAANLHNGVPKLCVSSKWTIQRTIQKGLKMPSRIAAQKPLLNVKMKAKRLKFAKAYKLDLWGLVQGNVLMWLYV